MDSKTPQFDTRLNEILENLIPGEHECAQKDISKYCEIKFKITEEDIEYYKMLKVPPPKCCPTCRKQRRFAFVNRIHYYKRKNDAPGTKENIISYVSPVSPLVVYDLDYYRSDKWDPLSFSMEYNSNNSFIDQFYNLRLGVPQYAIVRDPSSVNSEYSLNGRNLKNGYLVSGGNDSENVWYSIYINSSREIMDCQSLKNCEQCYEVVKASNLNLCAFCYFSKDCISSRFLYDCKNCQDCFGCVNLHNKKYCFFNEQLSKEDYERNVSLLGLDSRSNLLKTKDLFWKFVKENPVRANRSINAVNSFGALITNSNNCQNVITCENSENVRYSDMTMSVRDSMDIYAAGGSELLYETAAVGSDCANVKFSFGSKYIIGSEFLINCHNCQYCFACIGFENKKYCILNKQYAPEEYFVELDRIKSSLLEKGEYGELFPVKFSPFAYNSSEADLSYPLSKEEIESLGSYYQPEIDINTQGLNILETEEIPDSINDVADDITDMALICGESKRPFRIIKSELEFYRKYKLPLPSVHPLLRMKNYFKYLGSNLVYQGTCKKCGIKLETIYQEEDGWNPYCEKCYQAVVY